MKKILLTSLTVFGLTVSAQEEETTKVEIVNQFQGVEVLEKNEIRLNALDLLVHPALHVYYERVVSESSGFGASLFINFGDNDTTYKNVAFTPYYRFYFLDRKDYGASGLFVEAFSSFSSVNFDDYWGDADGTTKNESEFQFSMGVGLGKKWVNRGGFTFEVFAGVGRYFIDAKEDYYSRPEAHGRVGLSIGKRF